MNQIQPLAGAWRCPEFVDHRGHWGKARIAENAEDGAENAEKGSGKGCGLVLILTLS